MLVQDAPLLHWTTCTAIDPVDPGHVADPSLCCGNDAPYLVEMHPQKHHDTDDAVHAALCAHHAAAFRRHHLFTATTVRMTTRPRSTR